jgi:hypothetical protein
VSQQSDQKSIADCCHGVDDVCASSGCIMGFQGAESGAFDPALDPAFDADAETLEGCDRAKLGAAIRASGLLVNDAEIVAVHGCRVDFIDGGSVWMRPSVIREARSPASDEKGRS